ncbi:MAG: hypothetical protein ABJB47_12270 [Actinomycetota bacterium]
MTAPQDYVSSAPRPVSRAQRLVRRAAAILAECDYAQRRMAVLRLAPDRYVRQPDQAPDSYADFLFRTSGPLPHEPSARDRSSHGRAVR